MRLYVYDLIYTGNNEKMCIDFKESVKQDIDMSDLGEYFLGIKVTQTAMGIFICQQKYAKEALE